jgi:hypothetical protein
MTDWLTCFSQHRSFPSCLWCEDTLKSAPIRASATLGYDYDDDFISKSRRSPFRSFFTALDATTSPSLA